MSKRGFQSLGIFKKALLIKLVSVLGFGGMAGFCFLGCEKPVQGGVDAVETREGLVAQEGALEQDVDASEGVQVPSEDAEVYEGVLAGDEIHLPLPIGDRDVVALYGVRRPVDLQTE